MSPFSKSPSSSQGRRTSSDARAFERPSSSLGGVSIFPSSSEDFNGSERHRGYVENFRRSSVLGVRSRSNTTNSGSTNHSVTPSMSSTAVSSHRSSQDGRSMSISGLSRWNSSESSAKALFSRSSRVLRRNNSRMNLFALSNEKSDEIEDLANRRKSQLWQNGFRSKGDLNDTHAARKRTISEPFNFQHLTHTKAQHFPELDRTSQRELVTEFSAIRAAQAPRKQLDGIRADDLHFRNFSSEAINTPDSLENPAEIGRRPRPNHSVSNDSSERNLHSPVTGRGENARFADGFSPSSPPRSPQASVNPITPPPRTSSRAAFGSFSRPSGQSSPTSPSFSRPHTSSGFRDSRPFNFSMLAQQSPRSPSSNQALEEYFEDDMEIPHAVTTPDETAMQLRAPSFGGCGTELADVPEEEEGAFSFRRSARPFALDSPALLSPYDISDIDPLSQLDPLQFSEPGTQTSSRPLSQASDTLGAPFGAPPAFAVSAASPVMYGNFSPTIPMDGCWEDDIDYCYEHAAEADCDFEWSTLSSAPQLEGLRIDGPICLRENEALSVPTFEFPEPQAQAALAAGPGPAEAEGFTVSPSLLVPKDYEDQMLREALYEEMLACNPDAQHQYSLFAAGLGRHDSGNVSYRSSRTSPSKCDSQDSFNFSVGHQSLSSRSSVPDLVHSHPCKEVFDEAALRLADQIASLNASGSETSSLRRNGSLMQQNEQASSSKAPSFVQPEEDQHSQSQPRRQRSSSEGASALLSRAIDGKGGRTRSTSAAGSRRASRVSYNLFPAPPRHLPQ